AAKRLRWSSKRRVMPALADQLIDERQAPYIAAFEKFGERAPQWLQEIRRCAFDRFAELGFPTTRDEEWRFTNVAPVAGMAFDYAPELDDPARAAELTQ